MESKRLVFQLVLFSGNNYTSEHDEYYEFQNSQFLYEYMGSLSSVLLGPDKWNQPRAELQEAKKGSISIVSISRLDCKGMVVLSGLDYQNKLA